MLMPPHLHSVPPFPAYGLTISTSARMNDSASPSHVNTQPLVATSTGFFHWLERVHTVPSSLLSKIMDAETVFSKRENGKCRDVVALAVVLSTSYDNFTIYPTFIDPGRHNDAVNYRGKLPKQQKYEALTSEISLLLRPHVREDMHFDG